MRVSGGRHRQLLDLLVRALPGAVDGVASVGAGAVFEAVVTRLWVRLGGGCATHRAPPTEEAQGALIHELVLAGHGDGDLTRKNELQPLPGAPNVRFGGSIVPGFFHVTPRDRYYVDLSVSAKSA